MLACFKKKEKEKKKVITASDAHVLFFAREYERHQLPRELTAILRNPAVNGRG